VIEAVILTSTEHWLILLTSRAIPRESFQHSLSDLLADTIVSRLVWRISSRLSFLLEELNKSDDGQRPLSGERMRDHRSGTYKQTSSLYKAFLPRA